jgi:2,3-bisphosphoglycerate-independent phosphoglycerate mutase
VIHRPGSRPAPFTRETRSTPPHDITDQPVVRHLPTGPGSDWLRSLMDQSASLFREVPENVARGENAATNTWLWGIGRRPALPNFADRFGVRGAMITAVDLLRGLAALLGWTNIAVPGATGYLDTNYAGKGEYAIQALEDVDFVVVHVEGTDEASHEGDVHAKVQALEQIDQHIVGPLLRALEKHGQYRLLVSPDHPTFLRTKTHSYGFVPLALCGTGVTADPSQTYDEVTASRSALVFTQGHELMPFFLRRTH